MSKPTRVRSTLNTARLRRLAENEFTLAAGLAGDGQVAVEVAFERVRDTIVANSYGTNFSELTVRKYVSDLNKLERYFTAAGRVRGRGHHACHVLGVSAR